MIQVSLCHNPGNLLEGQVGFNAALPLAPALATMRPTALKEDARREPLS
jgi:hypothetical protein